MQGTEDEHRGALLSVAWENYVPPGADDPSLEQASAYAAVLVRTLCSAGYQPRRIELGLRRVPGGALELRVHGEVPGIPEPDFVSLARVTLTATIARRGFKSEASLQLLASLVGPTEASATSQTTALAKTRGGAAATTQPRAVAEAWNQWTHVGPIPVGRLAIGLLLGLTLGVVGLPRLEISAPNVQRGSSAEQQPTRITVTPVVPDQQLVELQPTAVPPTRVPATAAPARPTSTPPRSASVSGSAANASVNDPGVLFAHKLTAPVAGWPNNPLSNAWFGDGVYHLSARQPGRFVAVGVPLADPVGNAIISAQFHKVGGPSGGGYGLIVRDQGTGGERDSRNQAGRYVVLEVGDEGDIGIWQREQTRWIDILPWTHSDVVRSGTDANRLVVTTQGAALRFEVNGAVVADVDYNGLPPTGEVGVFVGGDLNEVALEWLRIESADK